MMTDELRTKILDALIQRWRVAEADVWLNISLAPTPTVLSDMEASARQFFASCFDMLSPDAAPAIREAALREAAAVAGTLAESPFNDGLEFRAVTCVEQAILDLIAKPSDPLPPAPSLFKFKLGETVRKVSGYGFEGEVMAAYLNGVGQPRYVVEVTQEGFAGWEHIFNGDQLELAPGEPA